MVILWNYRMHLHKYLIHPYFFIVIYKFEGGYRNGVMIHLGRLPTYNSTIFDPLQMIDSIIEAVW
jgi:hypothetical protein